MKKMLLLLLVVPQLAFFQPPNMTGISQALRSGNAEALGAYFSSSVEITVLETEDRYNKADAIKVVQGFFEKYQPKTFSEVHKGVSKGGHLHYCIGEMQTSSKTFRVYLLMEDGPNSYMIQQLRIDEE